VLAKAGAAVGGAVLAELLGAMFRGNSRRRRGYPAERMQIANRLDRETSAVMLVALAEAFW
jgi:23S rRNA-/tRNA-specific pseudouridylate synthase